MRRWHAVLTGLLVTTFAVGSAIGAPTAGAATPPTARTVAKKGPLITFTFDDGLQNQATRGLPIMQKAGIHGTFFLISGSLGKQYYMTVAQAKAVQRSGNEIGSHTVDHPELTKISSSKVTRELADSKKALEATFGPVTSFAYPYGAVNNQVESAVAKYYSIARTTEVGYNTRGSYDRYRLKIGYVLHNTTPAEVKSWMDDAKANNTWLILCYHRISDTDPDTFAHSVSNFQAEVNAAKRSGIPVVTMRQGYALTHG
jgi:peptidoglycan/xylan/chitin deacetylase (PgdA/CDA1 family)